MAKMMAHNGLHQERAQTSEPEVQRAGDSVPGAGDYPRDDVGLPLFARSANCFDQKEESEDEAPIERSKCVTETLSSLPQKCLIVHEVAARYGNIEHLVIREDGAVFLIETRLHRGFITHNEGLLLVDGRPFEADFVRQTTTNAFVLRDL